MKWPRKQWLKAKYDVYISVCLNLNWVMAYFLAYVVFHVAMYCLPCTSAHACDEVRHEVALHYLYHLCFNHGNCTTSQQLE